MLISLFEALLYYNGVQYDGNASKDVLVSLVKREVLDIMDESDEEWEPPGDHEINWTMPVSIKILEYFLLLYAAHFQYYFICFGSLLHLPKCTG